MQDGWLQLLPLLEKLGYAYLIYIFIVLLVVIGFFVFVICFIRKMNKQMEKDREDFNANFFGGSKRKWRS